MNTLVIVAKLVLAAAQNDSIAVMPVEAQTSGDPTFEVCGVLLSSRNGIVTDEGNHVILIDGYHAGESCNFTVSHGKAFKA